MKPKFFIFVSSIVVIATVRFVVPAYSSSLSPMAPQRLTVYDGVVTITNPAGVLELGATGSDITADRDIVLRPGGTTGVQTKFTGVGGAVQNLSLSGNLSMQTFGRSVCLGSVCKTAWSVNDEHWIRRDVDFGSWTSTFLEPADRSYGVRIGTTTQRFTTGTAVTAEGLLATNRGGGGTAATFLGNVTNIGTLDALGTTRINGQLPWTTTNQGAGSGLDADKFDGTNATIRHGYACDATVCLCFEGVPLHHNTIPLTPIRCIRMFASTSQQPPY